MPIRLKRPSPKQSGPDSSRSIAGGDQLALHALFTQTHRIVFTLIMRIVGNRETAEEVTLDVFHDVCVDPLLALVEPQPVDCPRARLVS